jgi:hypothetical protein
MQLMRPLNYWTAVFLKVRNIWQQISCSFGLQLFADQIKGDEIGGACGWYSWENKYILWFTETWRKRDNLEDLIVDGSVIL